MNKKHQTNQGDELGKDDIAEHPAYQYASTCLHEQCSQCGGTGRRFDGLGMCVHALVCPCPKCSTITL